MGARVYVGELRESKLDRQDQLEMMNDWDESIARELAAKNKAVEVAMKELEDFSEYIISREKFRAKLKESLGVRS